MKNMTRKYTSDRTEMWDVPEGTGSGVLVLNQNGQPGVTIAGDGAFRFSDTVGPYDISGPAGGVGYPVGKAEVATDGAFWFPVEGASRATKVNTLVYRESDGTLTVTGTGNTLIGKIDRMIGETGPTQASVWIGTTFNPAGA